MKLKLIFILFAILFITSKSSSAQEVKTFNFNELEPIFHYQNDTTYVINFWAMWCKPCVEELPHFEAIRKNYADKKVKVILVSLDFGKNVQERLAKFKIKRNVNSHIVILDDPDADTWISKVSEKWDGALPATVIYNKNNRDVFTRQVSYEELVESIDNIHED
ncbi:TlpA disulfide reductase family protein [Ancylomarina sp. 16SWW S1-10-2]|uniref:TlpA disulfide reductase family protein n=1 Tax=Ancylomarina sp. 16SWW S1-10-2 TaxID=2499681 RepID=UPI0012ADF889|nr:TlpA disulfide reductase family protein [Ancylomarina sp. 16SWW S1-10-2]MRT93505.1 TlpA family protein disulfide reductase [Ancylomarina sp. 16SWW S1-10-2]